MLQLIIDYVEIVISTVNQYNGNETEIINSKNSFLYCSLVGSKVQRYKKVETYEQPAASSLTFVELISKVKTEAS